MSDDESPGRRRLRRTPEEWAAEALRLVEALGFERQFGDEDAVARLTVYIGLAGMLSNDPTYIPFFLPISAAGAGAVLDEAIKHGSMPQRVVLGGLQLILLMLELVDSTEDGQLEITVGDKRLRFDPRDLLRDPTDDDEDDEDPDENS